MAYQALYREWRPQTFEKIIGQDHITRTLKNAVEAGRTGHAYLFCGTRGTGKTTTAKVLAKAINCLERQGPEPCNRCVNCVSINEGTSSDVIEVDAASNRGIDEIRDLREKIRYAPAAARYRVYIIDEVHMLTNEAFNALLKTLEEPPRHGVFILATTEPHKIPLTILSRCQRFDFRRIRPADIMANLKEVAAGTGLSVAEEAFKTIARAAEGGLRDALSILDKAVAYGGERITENDIHSVLGTVRADVLGRMAGYLAARETGEAIALLAGQNEAGKDLRLFSRDLAAFLRAILLERIAPGTAGREMWDEPERVAALAVTFTTEHLTCAIEALAGVEQSMKWSAMPDILLELALFKACRPELDRGEASLAARVALLEQRVARLSAGEGSGAESGPAVSLPPAEDSTEAAGGKSHTPAKAGANTGAVAGDTGKDAGPLPAGRSAAPEVFLPVAKAGAPKPHDAVKKAPVAAGESPGAGGVSGKEGPTLEEVREAWGQVIFVLKEERPPLYPVYCHTVPHKVNGRRLSVAFPEKDVLARGRAEQPDNKEYFERLLARILGGPWQVSLATYRGDLRPVHLPTGPKAPENPGRIFDGEEVNPGEEDWDSLFK
ncbi:MAG: DNA polymerase III subunit gamma/tau [Eubacteriales bacterium]